MKKILFLFFASLFPVSSTLAQITTLQTKKETRQQAEEPVEYDRTKNWLGADHIESYVGQVLYVATTSSPERGYEDFYTKKDAYPTDRWGEPAVKSEYNTRYEDLYGKYFIVDEVHEGKWLGDWWFLLHEKDRPEVTVWFKYDKRHEDKFPFVVVSHFEYLKASYVGKQFVLAFWKRDAADAEKFGSIATRVGDEDIKTGENIKSSPNDVWTCTDVTLTDDSRTLYLVVTNQKGQTSLLPASCMGQRANGTYWVYEKPDYDRYVARFGAGNMNKIRQRKISLGMTSEMLILSWGYPQSINSSSYGPDQWVYDRQYVYVENGRITAWN